MSLNQMNHYKKNNINECLNEIDDFDDENISFEQSSTSLTVKLRRIFFFTLLLISLFLCSILIVWYASTDSQRRQTNVFVQQALQGNVDFSILLDTKFQALGYFEWPWGNSSKKEMEYQPQVKQPPKPAINTTPIYSSTSKYKNLYSCSNRTAIQLEKKKLYKWKDADDQLHMSDRFPKTKNYKDLTIQNLRSDSFFELNLDSRYSQLPAFASDRMKRDVDQIYKILTKNVGVSQLNPIRLNLKLFDSKSQFNAYMKKVAPGLGTAGGFYISRLNEATVYTGNNDQRMYDVSRHEAVHAINNGAFGRMPTWLNEGLAEYFENLKFEKSMLRIVKPNQAHLELLSTKPHPPLIFYLNMNDEQWYQESDKDIHYAMGWSLVYFLMSSDKGKQFLKYMLDHLGHNYCKSIVSLDYINKNYIGGFKTFQREWGKWLSSTKQAHRY